METKALGKASGTIPEVGLGTSQYRGGNEPLRQGVSLGAFIDTAEMYGTEDVVGAAVQGAPSCNGWSFWYFEADGELRPVDLLRQRLRAELA